MKGNSQLCNRGLFLLHLENSFTRCLGVFYSDKDATVDDVQRAIAEEMYRPGKLLGYWAMQKKI